MLRKCHKMLQTIITLSSLLTATSLPNSALADGPILPTTEQVTRELQLSSTETQQTIEMLQACDRALNASKAESAIDGQLRQKQTELINFQSDRLVQLEKQNNSITNSPAFWFVTGMLVTGLTVRLVK